MKPASVIAPSLRIIRHLNQAWSSAPKATQLTEKCKSASFEDVETVSKQPWDIEDLTDMKDYTKALGPLIVSNWALGGFNGG
jgi:hypothetical protein